MGQNTGIAWCDHTWNPWWGCTKVSPGCARCYAETWAKRYRFLVWGPEAGRRLFDERHWAEPMAWNKAAARAGVRRRVFCGSMCDVFEENEILDYQRERLWRLIEATPNLVWLLLTKRPENVDGMAPGAWIQDGTGWPAHVWLGTSAEDQATAEWRIPELLRCPAPVRFLSLEPLLGRVELGLAGTAPADLGYGYVPVGELIHWVIVGGESGPSCRPMDREWVRILKAECANAGVAFFMKQLGGYPDKRADPARWPEDLRIREFPR